MNNVEIAKTFATEISVKLNCVLLHSLLLEIDPNCIYMGDIFPLFFAHFVTDLSVHLRFT